MSYPEPLMRRDRDFLQDLNRRLWTTGHMGQQVPNGFISDQDYRRVIAIMSDASLGLALHPTWYGMGIKAFFFPKPAPVGRRQRRPDPEAILTIQDVHFEGSMDEASVIQRRNVFLEKLFPFTQTPVNKYFRNTIGIGGIIDAAKLFLVDEPETPPSNAMNRTEWEQLTELDERLWYITYQYGDTARTRNTRVPTKTPRNCLTDADREILTKLAAEEKIFFSATTRLYGGIPILVYAPPWHRLANGDKRYLFEIIDGHFLMPKDSEPGTHRKLCLEFFKPLILSPANVAALERYSDGIPKIFRET
ncbi:MAG: hypothetical protein U0487_02885 [Patescibacteria group bacterium]